MVFGLHPIFRRVKKNFGDVKAFKRAKAPLLKQLVGTGTKKEKIKDMTLGSGIAAFTGETA